MCEAAEQTMPRGALCSSPAYNIVIYMICMEWKSFRPPPDADPHPALLYILIRILVILFFSFLGCCYLCGLHVVERGAA
jgi:hypothetical protein